MRKTGESVTEDQEASGRFIEPQPGEEKKLFQGQILECPQRQTIRKSRETKSDETALDVHLRCLCGGFLEHLRIVLGDPIDKKQRKKSRQVADQHQKPEVAQILLSHSQPGRQDGP
mmetsp:Transcript_34249/g.107279  ORF Transcript_34249/g.107279 Transcript_34249/m.107279 type:complete len:116 (-) Transcript_34249:1410-1757(-)